MSDFPFGIAFGPVEGDEDISIEELKADNERLLAEGEVKDRALRVACHGLGLWAADDGYDRAQRTLRMRDQCLNDISGILSSDPLHEDTGPQYGPSKQDQCLTGG